MASVIRFAVAATILALLAPAIAYYFYPAEAEPLTAGLPVYSSSSSLGRGLETARGLQGPVEVSGVVEAPAGNPAMMHHHLVYLVVEGRTVMLALPGCWQASSGEMLMGHQLASLLVGRDVYVRGVLMKTGMGPLIIAGEVVVNGITLERIDCTPMMPMGGGGMPHGGMPGGWGGWSSSGTASPTP
ncbi:hypothetical protein [Aeropyrum camini]|uniref:Uncharacterized protein n=1 Tax=Aeropyrum camini SY1 = JCM 12091 TaxID=1198449 RepID=U3T8Q9_9CREN|nr:hypothetical protein [Aeropyrum camini]BAN89912.1 hypothetical protein ACAM_0443 [Aeropyrum camini SY1 = JCM 12091]